MKFLLVLPLGNVVKSTDIKIGINKFVLGVRLCWKFSLYSIWLFSGGNGAFSKSDEEISFIIKWNDLEENMILKVE